MERPVSRGNPAHPATSSYTGHVLQSSDVGDDRGHAGAKNLEGEEDQPKDEAG